MSILSKHISPLWSIAAFAVGFILFIVALSVLNGNPLFSSENLSFLPLIAVVSLIGGLRINDNAIRWEDPDASQRAARIYKVVAYVVTIVLVGIYIVSLFLK